MSTALTPLFDCTESYSEDTAASKKRLDDVMHLAELCVEVLQQNEEHHADVSRHGNQPRWQVDADWLHISQLSFLSLDLSHHANQFLWS